MSTPRQILAAIFDMDGLLIDSEPLWDRAELDVMASLGVDITRRHELPDTLGLRIDMVVDLWFAQQPWNGPDRRGSDKPCYCPRDYAYRRDAPSFAGCARSCGAV